MFQRHTWLSNGKRLELIKLAGCRMGGKAIELLRILRLRGALAKCVARITLNNMKQFANIGEIVE